MSRIYRDAHRALQREFDSEALADRLEARVVTDHLSEDQQAFVASRDLFFLATVGADGWPSCSHKGGEPGFVRVLDARTLAWPSFDGNGMFLSLGNLLEQPKVGLLFVDFASPRRLRVEGTATVATDDPLRSTLPGAQLVVRIAVARVYPNCSRYVHHLELVERSRFVPRAGEEAPEPDWKRADWARDVVPKRR